MTSKATYVKCTRKEQSITKCGCVHDNNDWCGISKCKWQVYRHHPKVTTHPTNFVYKTRSFLSRTFSTLPGRARVLLTALLLHIPRLPNIIGRANLTLSAGGSTANLRLHALTSRLILLLLFFVIVSQWVGPLGSPLLLVSESTTGAVSTRHARSCRETRRLGLTHAR